MSINTLNYAPFTRGFEITGHPPEVSFKNLISEQPFEDGYLLPQTLEALGVIGSDALLLIDDGLTKVRIDSLRLYADSFGITSMLMRGGEACKEPQGVFQIIAAANKAGITRRGVLVGIGGGAVLDAVGSAAMQYRRGIKYIRFPTTLLAQIDAGIGIKVGYNYQANKNMLGGFYPPAAIITDLTFLENLSISERRAGIAEILKVAIVADEPLFDFVEKLSPCFVNSGSITTEDRTQLVQRAINALLGELVQDFYEQDPRRAADFGHEVAHPLEEVTNYQISHGDAVAIGMRVSAALGLARVYLSEETYQRIMGLFTAIGFPPIPQCDLLSLCHKIIKHANRHKGLPLFVVPTGIGSLTFLNDVTAMELLRAFQIAECRQVA